MKKILIILSLLLTGFYFTRAINLNLSSGDKLDISSWQDINNITSKINLDNNNLNINGKLVINGKICSGDICLENKAGTIDNPGLSCKDILDSGDSNGNGTYYIRPDGYSGDAFDVYCDMTYDGGGWMAVVSTSGNQETWDYTDINYDMTKSWTSQRSTLDKLMPKDESNYEARISYGDGNNEVILDYNTTYKAYYNSNYAVQISPDNCVARGGEACHWNTYSTVSYGYFCYNGDPFLVGGHSLSAFPGGSSYANSDNLGSHTCSSDRTVHGAEFGTKVYIREK